MYQFRQVEHLRRFLDSERAAGRSIGFVPTMGALHAGHLALIEHSEMENGCTVCSIFVNPTQFNDPADLEKYPRTEGTDLYLLYGANCRVTFLPEVEGIYPPENLAGPDFQFGALDKVMEGAFRPGHFAGVAQVVRRLLDIVEPDALYMGQKDYQQFCIIRSMIDQLGLPVRLVMVPTVRGNDGLALSSRNVRLSPEGKIRATAIFRALNFIRDRKSEYPPGRLEAMAREQLEQAGLRPEYVKITDPKTLQPLERFDETESAIVCVAAWLEGVRLIDNLLL